MIVGDSTEPILAPAIGPGTSVLVREVRPCITVRRVVFSDSGLFCGQDGGRDDIPSDRRKIAWEVEGLADKQAKSAPESKGEYGRTA